MLHFLQFNFVFHYLNLIELVHVSSSSTTLVFVVIELATACVRVCSKLLLMLFTFPLEGHPDVIQSDGGLATPEAYQSDLAYLKRKVEYLWGFTKYVFR